MELLGFGLVDLEEDSLELLGGVGVANGFGELALVGLDGFEGIIELALLLALDLAVEGNLEFVELDEVIEEGFVIGEGFIFVDELDELVLEVLGGLPVLEELGDIGFGKLALDEGLGLVNFGEGLLDLGVFLQGGVNFLLEVLGGVYDFIFLLLWGLGIFGEVLLEGLEDGS